MVRLPAACICVLLAASSLSAQSVSVQSRIENIDISRFPTVELQVSVTKTVSSDNITVNNVQLDENGVPQLIEYFDCPEDSMRLSVAILLDRSMSMAQKNDRLDVDSTKMREAKKAISTFLDFLGPKDESALFSFTTHAFTLRHIFTVEHDFTFDAASVKRSLVPIDASGGTRLWEAIINAVDLLKNRQGRRVLIVLTDGRNQFGESYHIPAIQNAVNAGIPVYTIGLGNDADVGALSGFSAATGGRFYFAPEASDLTDVFNNVASALITDACILRYTSSNPCLDGSRRGIELTLSGKGFSSAADSCYSLPLQLNPVTLSVQNGISAVGRDTVRVPINVAEQFSTTKVLSYAMTVGYDSDLMRYISIVSDGTMSQGHLIDVKVPVQGTLEISSADFYPFLPTGTLCELVFVCLPQLNDTVTHIEILAAELHNLCPTIMTAFSGGVSVAACEDHFYVGDSSYVVIPGDGSIVNVPLRLLAQPSTTGAFTGRFIIDITGLPFEILGVETAGTWSAGGGVIMQELGPGKTQFIVQTLQGRADSVLFYLRVRAREPQRFSSQCTIPLSSVEIESGCRASVEEDRGSTWNYLFIDGVCSPLLRRRNLTTVRNHPNPFSPETQIELDITSEGPVRLQVMDSHGRIVATLLDAHLTAGAYVHRFDASALPAGEYFAVVTTSSGQTVRPMLLLK
ncbi:MAG: VWA domain-containing protein [Bacteroidota bacterium]